MELRHLRYFVAVAEELHFGRAAARLHLAQPALSQQVKQLEKELNVLLLNRTKRKVSLTEPGRAFLGDAHRILEAADRAIETARRAASGEEGTLRVGYVDLATWLAFPSIVRTFRQRSPAVHVSLVELHHEPQRDALLRGDLDLGFLSLTARDHGLEGIRVGLDPLVVALPADHRRATGRTIRLADLAEEDWVLFPVDLRTVYLELVLGSCSQAGFVPRVVQEAGQLQALAGLVAAGAGVTLLPRSMALAPRAGIAYRRLSGRAPALPLHLSWREGQLPPAGVRFVEIARKVARQ